MTVTVKYKQVSGFEFDQSLTKISRIQTDGRTAITLRRIIKVIKAAKDSIRDEYRKDIIGTFAVKDEVGKIVETQEGPGSFTPDPARIEEFEATVKEFGLREAVLQCQPFTLAMLGDTKMSPAELESLDTLFDENPPTQLAEAPPVPMNVGRGHGKKNRHQR